MKVNYNVSGAELDSLVAAISEELNAPINHIGKKSYEVGGYNIDKSGMVTGVDNWELIADLSGLHSFKAISVKYDTLQETEEPPPFESLRLSEREELGLGRERHDHPGEDGMLASDVPESADVIFRENYVYTNADGNRATETIEYPTGAENISKLMALAGGGGNDKNRVFYAETWESAIPRIYDFLPENYNLDELNHLARQIQSLNDNERKVYTAAIETKRYWGMDKLINLAANIVNFHLEPADKQSNVQDSDGILTSKGYLVEQKNNDVIFSVTFACTDANGEWRDETLDYPAPKETLDKFLSDVGIGSDDKNRRFYCKAFDCYDPKVERYLPGGTNFDEMNYLAARIHELSTEQRELFSAAIETASCRRMDTLINLAANIAANGEGKKPYRFLSDIPPEERATAHLDYLTLPDAIAPVINVELSPLLLQIHAVCGDYLADAPANLATLEGMRTSEFLLLIDERGAFFTGAAHAYREASPQHDHLMTAVDSSQTHLFSLHVTDIWTKSGEGGEPLRGPIIGDIVYENLRDRQWDIKLNAVVPTIVDGQRHFESSDYTSVRRHLERVAEHHQNADAEERDPFEFLSVINYGYMAQVEENPSRGVIRIPNQVAKEILARSDGPIHLIADEKTETLTRQDILRVLKFGKDDAFAIKAEDFHGFEKWAKRTAPEMVRQCLAVEREEHKKAKGEEL